MPNHTIRETVLKSVRKHNAFVAVRKAIVAVSGGCDSVALLHLLLSIRAEIGIELHVASLNHSLRGESGRSDLEFVGDLARQWGLDFTPGEADVSVLSRQSGVGIEEAARHARYKFLADVARREGAEYVVVGHHAVDQAETILMHLIRGSGARGLQGMRVESELPGHPGFRLIRPLISVTKEQLVAYCAEHGLPFRHDSSNDDTSHTRNFLRHEVIVRLQRLNPGILDAFARLAETAAVEEDFFAKQFASLVLPQSAQSNDHWRISRDTFAAMHPALQRRFLRVAFEQLSGGSITLNYDATLAAIEWSLSARTGSRRQLGANLDIYITYDDLTILRENTAIPSGAWRLIPAKADIELDPTTAFSCYGLTISISLQFVPAGNCVQLDLPVGFELRLRGRKQGERFKPKGMGGHSRKIKDWMIDRKIPRDLRDRIPLLTANGEIVAICLAETWHLADLSHFDRAGTPSQTLFLG